MIDTIEGIGNSLSVIDCCNGNYSRPFQEQLMRRRELVRSDDIDYSAIELNNIAEYDEAVEKFYRMIETVVGFRDSAVTDIEF